MRKEMPIGVSDFKEVIEKGYYFIDKTNLIKDLLTEKPKVILFARPRRFGKTLMMSMLQYYFNSTTRIQTKALFDGLSISQADEKFRQEQGKYPVIYITLKDVKKDSWDLAWDKLKELISDEINHFSYLLDSDALTLRDKTYLRNIISGQARTVEYEDSLMKLTKFLAIHHGVSPILLIDEYDTLLQAGFEYGYYDTIITFMRSWLSGALKDNSNLNFAVLTGILRVAKESIFSGLNNLEVNTILDPNYSEYFGFTEEDIEQLTKDYDCPDKLLEIKDWYDGYLFGGREIYNPWSVINYFSHHYTPKAYWLNTSSNSIIQELLKTATANTQERLQLLLQGNLIETTVDDTIIYHEIYRNEDTLFNFMLFTGYLKVAGRFPVSEDMYLYSIKIPNKEIMQVYKSEIRLRMAGTSAQAHLIKMVNDLLTGKTEAFEDQLSTILKQMASTFDTLEAFYHGLILGMTALLVSDYEVKSNRESGYGRFDLAFFPKNNQLSGVLMEFKVAKKTDHLETVAQEALHQITEKAYRSDFTERGIKQVYLYGIFFYGKQVKVLKG